MITANKNEQFYRLMFQIGLNHIRSTKVLCGGFQANLPRLAQRIEFHCAKKGIMM